MFKVATGLAFLGVIGSLTLWASYPQQEEQIEQDTSRYMERKLESANAIVRGLAIEDFDAIGKAAQQLTLLSHESDWKVVTTDDYLRLSNNFRGSTNRLNDAALEKDLNACTLAYIEVTLNCVRCHQYLRGPRK